MTGLSLLSNNLQLPDRLYSIILRCSEGRFDPDACLRWALSDRWKMLPPSVWPSYWNNPKIGARPPIYVSDDVRRVGEIMAECYMGNLTVSLEKEIKASSPKKKETQAHLISTQKAASDRAAPSYETSSDVPIYDARWMF